MTGTFWVVFKHIDRPAVLNLNNHETQTASGV